MADKKAISDGDSTHFATMLLTAAYPQQNFTLAIHFSFTYKQKITYHQSFQAILTCAD